MPEARDFLASRKLAYRIKRKFKINLLFTDGNFAYWQIKLSKKHVIIKSEICLIESKNSVIRDASHGCSDELVAIQRLWI